jgi:hypothetical protein
MKVSLHASAPMLGCCCLLRASVHNCGSKRFLLFVLMVLLLQPLLFVLLLLLLHFTFHSDSLNLSTAVRMRSGVTFVSLCCHTGCSSLYASGCRTVCDTP